MDDVSSRQSGDALPTALTRRTVLRAAAGGFGLFFLANVGGARWIVEARATSTGPRLLNAKRIPKFQIPMPIPSVMPKADLAAAVSGTPIDYYEIAVRQFTAQVLPAPLPRTTVWGYGPAARAGSSAPPEFTTPAPTIEAEVGRPIRVKWINDLVDSQGRYLPHLLPVDPFLHWANPGAGAKGTDDYPPEGTDPGRYTGPVPMVAHLHGVVTVGDESDGFSEAWFLPDATNIPKGYARHGRWFSFFARKARRKFGVRWARGTATYQYPNEQRAGISWFHDHTLGLTRLNVYAGTVGFYLLRGGPEGDDSVADTRTGQPAVLPGPGPRLGDPDGAPVHEIPLAIQDRSFYEDGSLFYPASREYFDSIAGPFQPATDVPPVWNPEFFGNSIIVNGVTWPWLAVEQRRYRFRVLNGCNSRFLMLDFSGIPGVSAWQIGTEGGFLAAPVDLTTHHTNRLLLAPAERADVIVDFTGVPVGSHVLRNVGPDEPFGGGQPRSDFEPARPATTGRVLEFRVGPIDGIDSTTPPAFLGLPPIASLSGGSRRRVAMLEEMSANFPDAPIAAYLGTVGTHGHWQQHDWGAPVTETPAPGAVEVWEVFNTTEDAHPVHLHAVYFQVVDRQPITVDEKTQMVSLRGRRRLPNALEHGWKDTVIAYPGEVLRLRMRFGQSGTYMWHCHILEHEDNEMMRPVQVGPRQPGQPRPRPAHESAAGTSPHGTASHHTS
jgi:FtsP/CotA-like multicopper oxidase with cupredoxin domain